jgi:hypothetical protein
MDIECDVAHYYCLIIQLNTLPHIHSNDVIIVKGVMMSADICVYVVLIDNIQKLQIANAQLYLPHSLLSDDR